MNGACFGNYLNMFLKRIEYTNIIQKVAKFQVQEDFSLIKRKHENVVRKRQKVRKRRKENQGKGRRKKNKTRKKKDRKFTDTSYPYRNITKTGGYRRFQKVA